MKFRISLLITFFSLFVNLNCRDFNYFTISNSDTSLNKTTPATVDSTKQIKSPWGATWRSLVFPGWGQIYVENYWKAPIFIAGAGTLIYFIIHNNSQYNKYQSMYDQIKSQNGSSLDLDYANRYKEYYRDYRDQSIFYLAGVYILSAVDAYVGAHLFDFDVSDKLSMQLLPNINNGLSLNFSYRK